VLVISDYYLPGYKGGGPLRTIANMVGWLGDDFDFYILAADRDLGEDTPYSDIQTGTWQVVGNAQVRYLRPEEMSFSGWRQLLNKIDYDILYLNSFFSSNSVKIMLLRRLGRIPQRPIVIAPRGEFHRGALAIKPYKKLPYLVMTKLLGMYRDVTWQASNIDEAATIRRQFPRSQVKIAPNLPLHPLPPQPNIPDKTKSQPTRLVFISRISSKKNLDGALKILQQVNAEVAFDIYGPVEDGGYWERCQQLMDALPPNVKAQYCGAVHPDDVIATFAQYHLFLFPTKGENYGHVIWEALYAGCPVLTSDQTAWDALETEIVGWAVPLHHRHRYVEIIEDTAAMTKADFQQMATRAQHYAAQVAVDETRLDANRHLFME